MAMPAPASAASFRKSLRPMEDEIGIRCVRCALDGLILTAATVALKSDLAPDAGGCERAHNPCRSDPTLRIADSGCAFVLQGSRIEGMRPAAGSVIGFDGPRFTPGEEKQT